MRSSFTPHLPPPHFPGEAPSPPEPSLSVMQPPPWTEKFAETYILECAVGEIPIPFVLDLGDLPCRLIIVYHDLAVDGLFLVDTLDNVAGL